MFSKAKLNFVVDAVILIAFLASAVSGIVLLALPHGGYQGGRNLSYGEAVLFLTRDGWNDVHVWGSLAMIAGIGIHVALHWKWIVCMVKRSIGFGVRGGLVTTQPVPVVIREGDSR